MVEVLPANCVAYWKLDEDSGDAADSSGNSHTLTNTSCGYEAGKLNNCATTGDGKKLQCADHAHWAFGTGNFTIALWFKYTDAGRFNAIDNEQLFTSASTWCVYQHETTNNDKLVFGTGAGAQLIPSGTTNDGNWHRYVITREGTGANQAKLYVDGAAAITGTCATNFTEAASNFLCIGDDGFASSSGIEHIDEVLIIKGTAVDSTWVATDWNSGAGVQYTLAVDVTITPGVLTLSTTETSPLYLITIPRSLALSGGLSLPIASPVGMNIRYNDGTITLLGQGTKGTKMIRSNYPVATGLNGGYQKQVGQKYLHAEKSMLSRRDSAGL